MKIILPMLFLLSVASLSKAEPPKVGVHYSVITNPLSFNSNKIHVQEFFTYDCDSCYKKHQIITQTTKRWGSKVQYQQIPLRKLDKPSDSQKIFYTLGYIGQLEPSHTELLRIGSMVGDGYLSAGKINLLLQGKGVDLQKFNGMYSSVHVAKKQAEATALENQFNIKQESAIVVNGRYLIKSNMDTFAITLNYLINKEYKRLNNQ